MAGIDDAMWRLADVLSGIRPSSPASRVRARCVRTDPDGTAWLSAQGNPEPIPVSGGAVSYGEGDEVEVGVGATPSVVSNVSSPSSTVRDVSMLLRPVSKVAESAAEIASAIGQHFWADDGGAHVSTEEGNALGERNILMNSLGILLRRGATFLASFGDSAVAFYDGQGNEAENVVAQFGADGAVIGRDDESHMELDYHSMQFVDKEGETYFHVSDLRGSDGTAELTETFRADGKTRSFDLSLPATDTNYSVTVDGSPAQGITKTKTGFQFATAPQSGSTISATYVTTSSGAKAFTFGSRATGSGMGMSSFAEGDGVISSGWVSHAEGTFTVASGSYSHAEGAQTGAYGYGAHAEGTGSHATNSNTHAEGFNTIASGEDAHAEGYATVARGDFSHAEGYETEAHGKYSHASGNGTFAEYDYQTVIGSYNANKSNNLFEIGNGELYDSSNALEVDWSGNVVAAGTVTASMQTGTMTLNTTNCTLNTDYNRAWHNGVVATVQLGMFTLNSALANGSSVVVGTVPSGYRPVGRIYANVACALAGVTGLLVAYVGTDGTITLVNRSGASLSTSVGIIITATYAI